MQTRHKIKEPQHSNKSQVKKNIWFFKNAVSLQERRVYANAANFIEQVNLVRKSKPKLTGQFIQR